MGSADTFIPAHAPGAVHYQVFDELVIYSPSAAQAASLNGSARAIWQLCDGQRTVEEISIALTALLGVSPDLLRDDVWDAVKRLYQLGLLCENGPALQLRQE